MRFILTFLAAMTLCVGAAAGTGEPKLVIAKAEHDFGTIDRNGGVVRHDFMVRNEGTTPLVILKAFASCSCTEAKPPRKPIMPGDSAAIRVSYNPKTQAGTVFKVIQVYSNDPAKRAIITIKGEIK